MSKLNESLAPLNLPPAAVKFLCDLYLVLQAWDDFVDGDEMPRAEKDRAIYASLTLPANPFYAQNLAILLPLISNLVLKWKAADTAEREGGNLHMAYSWRAGFFDVVLQVVCLVHGPDETMQKAHHVMDLYGESFESYAREFSNA